MRAIFDFRRLLFGRCMTVLIAISFVCFSATIYAAIDTAPVRSIPTSERVVALTFDDGPDPRYTPRVLTLLRMERIHATFFEIGELVEKHPGLARAVVTEGHVVGNHTYSHADIEFATSETIQTEIAKCEDAIIRVTGKRPVLFRPPKGRYNGTLFQILQDRNYHLILWKLCVEHKASPTPVDMAHRVIANTRPGTIILAHDGRLNREKDMEALPIVIRGLKAKGYRFVTIPELLALRQKASGQHLKSVTAGVEPGNRLKQQAEPADRGSRLSTVMRHILVRN
ncbi:MAG: polysaccharide deacetylase family protein [Armatimonadota bacterium]